MKTCHSSPIIRRRRTNAEIETIKAAAYGLLARDVVLPDENADAFADLRNAIHVDLASSGGVHPYSTAWLVTVLAAPWSAYDPEADVFIG